MMLDRVRELIRPFYLRHVYFRLFPDRKPPYFSACWEYPDLDFETAAFQRDPKPVVLFLPMNDWHTRIQRTQHLARALSERGYRCIYLNPHLGREFPRSFSKRQPLRVTRLAEDLFELHVPLPREPVFHHRLLTGGESARITSAVTELLDKFGSTNLVQILAFPVWLEAALVLRDRHQAPILYDCHDYLPGFSGIAQPIVDLEPDTFRKSNRILCSSTKLLERANSFAPHTPAILLRNAASSGFLNLGRLPRTPASPVTIGYIGALDSWFDVASFQAAAVAHPEWQFQLIGRIENEGVRRLREFTNVEFLGEIPFRQLGPFLASFAVATIPFVLNPLIDATDPIKAYEYLAVGIPVVSANLPELDRFGGLVCRYKDPADFVQKLEYAIANDSAELTGRRRAAAAQETWEKRADLLAAAMEDTPWSGSV